MALTDILAGKPAIQADELSATEKAQVLEKVLEIVQSFFSMRPRGHLMSDGFLPLGGLLSSSLRNPQRNYEQKLAGDLDPQTLCLVLDRVPDEQEVYRMQSRTRYIETSLLVTLSGQLVLLRSNVECEHDSIIDATIYRVFSDEFEVGDWVAATFYSAKPYEPQLQPAIRKLQNFLKLCLKQVQPIIQADGELTNLLKTLGMIK